MRVEARKKQERGNEPASEQQQRDAGDTFGEPMLAAFELGVNKTFAILTIVGSVLLTAALWFYLLGGAK